MTKHCSLRSLYALSVLVFFVSDVQGGIGPILTTYLRSQVGSSAAEISVALAITGVSCALFLLPCGLLVDNTRYKRLLLAIACISIALSRFIILIQPTFYFILVAQFLFGMAFAIIMTTISSVSLGLVSKRYFPRRAALNEILFHAGTVFAIVTMGIVAQWYSNRWIIYCTMLFSLIALIPLWLINPQEIDHNEARAAVASNTKLIPFSTLLTKHSILIAYAAFIIYQIATASLLPLVGEKLAKLDPQHDAMTMSASIVLAQIMMVLVGISLRSMINKIGRKPIFLCGFLFVIVRAVLFSMTDNTYYLLAIQLLDGIASGIFGVMSIIIVSDLAAGTGRFNFMVGLLGLCNSLGLALSNFISGFATQQYGISSAFLVLASIALVGLLFSGFILPETAKTKSLTKPKVGGLKYLLR